MHSSADLVLLPLAQLSSAPEAPSPHSGCSQCCLKQCSMGSMHASCAYVSAVRPQCPVTTPTPASLNASCSVHGASVKWGCQWLAVEEASQVLKKSNICGKTVYTAYVMSSRTDSLIASCRTTSENHTTQLSKACAQRQPSAPAAQPRDGSQGGEAQRSMHGLYQSDYMPRGTRHSLRTANTYTKIQWWHDWNFGRPLSALLVFRDVDEPVGSACSSRRVIYPKMTS